MRLDIRSCFSRNRWHTLHRAVEARGGMVPTLRRAVALIRAQGLKQGVRSVLRRASVLSDYKRWIGEFDTITASQRQWMSDRMSEFDRQPLISILVPAYDTPAELLREMIESVRQQTYSNWELCICNDASVAPHVRVILEEYVQADARVKVVHRRENGHICVASNDALALASGEFIALLDHDDRLAEHALFMVALYLHRYPNARMLFSDEDKLTANGERIEPYFKGEWDPFLMLGQNAFSHLGVFETALVREVGAFRIGFEGSQDHDLALRCAEHVRRDAIVHIPHVLYHWRSTEQSTAMSVAAKPYVRAAAMRAVQEHLSRTGRDATVEPLVAHSSMLRVCFKVPNPAPTVSIIIPTRDCPALLARCIDTLCAKTRYPRYEILIVDNGTVDPAALALLARYSRLNGVTVIRDESPFNYSALNNQAAERATGTLLCLLNNDIEITDGDWLEVLVGYAMQSDVGAVGAALWYPDETLQHGGVVLAGKSVAGHMHHRVGRNEFGYFGRAKLAHEVAAVSAACLVVRADRYRQVGGLNADDLKVAYNDVDLCLRLRQAGYRNVYVPYANLCHHESASRGSDVVGERAQRLENEAAFMRRVWGAALENDASYNPNLAIDDGRFFTLAFPPRIGQFD
ncbi:glycosyltransferase family 2 protein [Burkholderia territorii]|uniref:glycosyltransferase family 2 protein n=1 Tax=Burkholderia territorii TaxID=1503055 RepID=UPI0007BAC148|nr:glycosyltransferase family 2 protein [Burkholderia territorii]